MRGFYSVCLVGCDDGMLRFGYDANPRYFLKYAKTRHGRPDAKLLSVWFLTDQVLAKRIVSEVRRHMTGTDTKGWFEAKPEKVAGLVELCAKQGRVPIYTLEQAVELRRKWLDDAEQEMFRLAEGRVANRAGREYR